MQVADTLYTEWNPTTAYQASVTGSLAEDRINVKDADSGDPIPVACLRGYDADYLQSTTTCFAPLEFPEVPFFSSDAGESGEVSVRRRSKIIVAAYFTSQSQVDAKIWIKSNNGLWVPIANATLTALPGADSNGWYQSAAWVIDTFGGDVAKVTYNTPLAGEISVSMGVV